MNKKTILTIVIVIIVAMIAIFYLNGQGGSNQSGSLTADVQTSQSSDAKYISSLLEKMKQVKLDDSIFQDPIFQGLKDNTATFQAQASGRDNPFAPLGANGVSVQSSSSKSK